MEELYIIFLDWEKAFDQPEMINAVLHMNVPQQTVEKLKRIYENIQFCIRDSEGLSTERDQRTGIRQGCPLSPYLFIILMAAMFLDVHAEVRNINPHHGSRGGAPWGDHQRKA